jgi:hypothetical protein
MRCPTADTPTGDNRELFMDLDLGTVRTFLAIAEAVNRLRAG